MTWHQFPSVRSINVHHTNVHALCCAQDYKKHARCTSLISIVRTGLQKTCTLGKSSWYTAHRTAKNMHIAQVYLVSCAQDCKKHARCTGHLRYAWRRSPSPELQTRLGERILC